MPVSKVFGSDGMTGLAAATFGARLAYEKRHSRYVRATRRKKKKPMTFFLKKIIYSN